MSVEQYSKSKLALSRDLINPQVQYLSHIMDVRTAKNPSFPRKISVEGKHGGRMFRYFTLESLFLLVCLTASLLILPLILPPLPPPPFMLLMIPICILVLLMFLAFMPSNVRETHACM